MKGDTCFMQRCIDLGRSGLGRVSPNPMVGAVIVYQDRIIGEGYHEFAGGPHAEVHAIASVIHKDLLPFSTIYVNLEPCNHHGHTPPCTEAILQAGIPKVVIANRDPNKAVQGKGVEFLRDAGVEVVTGILSEEGKNLNRRFFTFHARKRPYTILKWAQTLDGYIDIDRSDPNTPFQWISNDLLKRRVHQWRTEEDSILVGYITAQHDNPRLTVREWAGRNPWRMVLDEQLSLPASHYLFDGSAPTLVFTALTKESTHNLTYITLDFQGSIIAQINAELYSRGIQSMIVEGGRELLDSYFESGSWDEVRVLEGNKFFGKGLKGPDFRGTLVSSSFSGNDRLLRFIHR